MKRVLIEFNTVVLVIFSYGGIREFCSDIKYGSDSVRAYARWVNYVFDTDGQCRRPLSYKSTIQLQRNESDVRGHRTRNFLYCTQLGWNFYLTENNPPGGVFPNIISNETFHINRCQDALGNL